MNCEHAQAELIAYLNSELSASKVERLQEHLAGCQTCREKLEEARRVLEWTKAASDTGIQSTVHSIITEGIRAKASDIHIEPRRQGDLLVRHRVDGVLHEQTTLSSDMRTGVIARIKMMAEMNVAETMIPQDGRFSVSYAVNGKEYDLRATSIPFVHGEGIVIRILDRSSCLVGLDKLNIDPETIEKLKEIVHRPVGLVIIGGPAGSGKTTLLYSALMETNRENCNVVSIESPVEYILDGVSQVQVAPRKGLTFPAAIRAFLRADPDVIMCGEVQDGETAHLLADAALTGHLVLTSLHINHADEAIDRLRMMLDNYFVAASLTAVTCQRLVRMVCSSCAELYPFDDADPALGYLGISSKDVKSANIRVGRGCDICCNTGYRGRTALIEILDVDREIRKMIGDCIPSGEIREYAVSKGFRTMRDDARNKVLQGITTPEEAMRVLF